MLDAQYFCLQCGLSLQPDSQEAFCSEKCTDEASNEPHTPSHSSPHPQRTPPPRVRNHSQRTVRARVHSTKTIRETPIHQLRQSSPATPVRAKPDPSFALLSDASASRIVRWVSEVHRRTISHSPDEAAMHTNTPSSLPCFSEYDSTTDSNSDSDDVDYFYTPSRHKSRHSCPADLRSSLSYPPPMSPTAVVTGSALAPAVSNLTPTYAVMSTVTTPPVGSFNEKYIRFDEDLTPPARLATEHSDPKRALELALGDLPSKSPTQKSSMVVSLVQCLLPPTPSESGVKLRIGNPPRKGYANRPRAHTTGQVDYVRPSYQTLTVTSQTPTSLPIATPEDAISELNLDPSGGVCVPNEEELLLCLRSKTLDTGISHIQVQLIEHQLRTKNIEALGSPDWPSTSPIRIPRGQDETEVPHLTRGRPMDRDFRRRSISNACRD